MPKITKYTKANSTIVRDGKAVCQKCNAQNLQEEFGASITVGDGDFDTYEFERGVWSVCESCKNDYVKQSPNKYYER